MNDDHDATQHHEPTPTDEPTLGPPADPHVTDTVEATPARQVRPVASAPPGYEITGEYGRGGMGVVYAARHINLNRPVALKMVLGGAYADIKELVRFLTEAEAVASVDHPNVVRVFEFGKHDGLPFLVMEAVPGGSLADLLKKRGPMPHAEAEALVGQITHGVAAAHAVGIIHRDLKPANILIAADGTPKVTDFGLAKRGGSSDLTSTNAILGTPGYMPPEQASGRTKFVGPAADVYALGAILFACLTGRAPFEGSNHVDVILQVIQDAPPSVARLAPGTPRDLALIVEKCLAKDPSDRYATAAEFADDLHRRAAGETIVARPAGTRERAWKWANRNRGVVVAASIVAAALLAATAVSTAFGLSAQRQAGRADRAAAAADASATNYRAEFERAEAEAAKATRALAQARQQRELAEGRLYASQMNEAGRLWNDGLGAASIDLIGKTPWDRRGWEHDYLFNLSTSGHTTLKGHSQAVASASFSPDGRRVVTGSCDDTAKVWDAGTGAAILRLTGHTSFVLSASFSPDGRRVVTGSDDKTARVWDAGTGAAVLTLAGHTDRVTAASFSPDGRRVVTGSEDKTARVWDAGTGAAVLTLAGHTRSVTSASFSPDGRRVVTGSNDGTAKVWDAGTGAALLTLTWHKYWVTAASFSPDGRRVVTGGDDGTARVWDAGTGAVVLTLTGHTGRVTAASFSPDGRRVVTGSADKTAKVWDAGTGAAVLTLTGHTDRVTASSFSPDGRRVVTGSADKTAKVWNASLQHDEDVLVTPGSENTEGIVHFSATNFLFVRKAPKVYWKGHQPYSGEVFAYSMTTGQRVEDEPVPEGLAWAKSATWADGGKMAFIRDGVVVVQDVKKKAAFDVEMARRFADSARPKPAWHLEQGWAAVRARNLFAVRFHARQFLTQAAVWMAAQRPDSKPVR